MGWAMHKNSVFQSFSMNPFNFQLFPQITYSAFPNYFYKSQMQWNIRNKQQQNITDFEFSICLWFERFAVKHRFLFFFIMWTSISCLSPYFEWQLTPLSSNKRMSIFEKGTLFHIAFKRLISQWVLRWLFFVLTLISIFQMRILTWSKQW